MGQLGSVGLREVGEDGAAGSMMKVELMADVFRKHIVRSKSCISLCFFCFFLLVFFVVSS